MRACVREQIFNFAGNFTPSERLISIYIQSLTKKYVIYRTRFTTTNLIVGYHHQSTTKKKKKIPFNTYTPE